MSRPAELAEHDRIHLHELLARPSPFSPSAFDLVPDCQRELTVRQINAATARIVVCVWAVLTG